MDPSSVKALSPLQGDEVLKRQRHGRQGRAKCRRLELPIRGDDGSWDITPEESYACQMTFLQYDYAKIGYASIKSLKFDKTLARNLPEENLGYCSLCTPSIDLENRDI